MQARQKEVNSSFYQPILCTWTSQQCGEFYKNMDLSTKYSCGVINFDESEGAGGALTNEEWPLRLATQF